MIEVIVKDHKITISKGVISSDDKGIAEFVTALNLGQDHTRANGDLDHYIAGKLVSLYGGKISERAAKGGPGSGNWGHAGRPGKRGGSASGTGGLLVNTHLTRRYHRRKVRGYPKRQDFIDDKLSHLPPKIAESVVTVMGYIVEQKHETLFAFDNNGRTALKKDGNKDTIRFGDREIEALSSSEVSIHNHPSNSGNGFSGEDIALTLDTGHKRMFVITKAPDGSSLLVEFVNEAPEENQALFKSRSIRVMQLHQQARKGPHKAIADKKYLELMDKFIDAERRNDYATMRFYDGKVKELNDYTHHNSNAVFYKSLKEAGFKFSYNEYRFRIGETWD